MTDLFEGAHSAAPKPKPTNWRKPTDPREHVCRGCAGVATCGTGDAWWCVACVPASFWPTGRGA